MLFRASTTKEKNAGSELFWRSPSSASAFAILVTNM